MGFLAAALGFLAAGAFASFLSAATFGDLAALGALGSAGFAAAVFFV